VQQGAIFATTSIQIPPVLPADGSFYLSSSSIAMQPAAVDDRIVFKVDGGVVFSYTYGNSVTVTPALVSMPRDVVARLAGRQVSVEFVDVYGVSGGASRIFLIWSAL
jgi:hypothetical protein